ncbi:UDP binding domain-containing protein, partial [Bacteroidota bacterium]
ENGYDMRVLKSVEDVNDDQKSVLVNKARKYFNDDLKGKTIGLWGLSFKPQTDDMREAPSLVIIDQLIEAGVNIKAYDPVAMKETHHKIGDKIQYAKDQYEALIDVDCLMIVTEWSEFRCPNYEVMKKLMKNHLIFDGRNIFEGQEMMDLGFEYFDIGNYPVK